jgi:hypothetical protein
MVKKENGLLTHITKLLEIFQVILWPFLLLWDLTINLVHPVNEVIGDWFCALGWFLLVLFMIIVLNSLYIAALMRYFFIIHQTRVNAYGKTRVKRILLVLSIAIPALQFILPAAAGSPSIHL